MEGVGLAALEGETDLLFLGYQCPETSLKRLRGFILTPHRSRFGVHTLVLSLQLLKVQGVIGVFRLIRILVFRGCGRGGVSQRVHVFRVRGKSAGVLLGVGGQESSSRVRSLLDGAGSQTTH